MTMDISYASRLTPKGGSEGPEIPTVNRDMTGSYLDGGNSKIFLFSALFGEDEPILTIIFFKGVGSTTT